MPVPDYTLPDDTQDDTEENPNTEHHASMREADDSDDKPEDKGDAKT